MKSRGFSWHFSTYLRFQNSYGVLKIFWSLPQIPQSLDKRLLADFYNSFHKSCLFSSAMYIYIYSVKKYSSSLRIGFSVSSRGLSVAVILAFHTDKRNWRRIVYVSRLKTILIPMYLRNSSTTVFFFFSFYYLLRKPSCKNFCLPFQVPRAAVEVGVWGLHHRDAKWCKEIVRIIKNLSLFFEFNFLSSAKFPPPISSYPFLSYPILSGRNAASMNEKCDSQDADKRRGSGFGGIVPSGNEDRWYRTWIKKSTRAR